MMKLRKAAALGLAGMMAVGTLGVAAEASTEEKETITIALPQNTNVENYDTNYLTTLLEDEFNIDIEFQLLPSDANDAKSKFTVMASSGTELPDIVLNLDLSLAEQTQYGDAGVFVPINDYIGNGEYFSQIPEEKREKILKDITTPDGNIYGYPTYVEEDWVATAYRFWINKVWLDKLGLKEPTTTDELKEVLKAFAEQDPNGNGKADEIAMTGSLNAWGADTTRYLLNSFLYYTGPNGLTLDEEGKIIAPFTQDAFKEGLEYIKSLCDEGLLSPAMFTQDAAQFTNTISNDPQIVGATCSGGFGYWSGAAENANFQEMELLPPVAGPEGVAYAYNSAINASATYFITSSCEDVDLAVKLADFFYRPDISMTVRYGQEGVNWSQDPEVCKEYAGQYESIGIECQTALIDEPWSKVQNADWYQAGPRYCPREIIQGLGSKKKGEEGIDYNAVNRSLSYDYYTGKTPENVLPTLVYTQEESEQISEIMSNVKDYVNTFIAETVTGARSLDDWDNYLSELDNMGLQDYISISEEAYARVK